MTSFYRQQKTYLSEKQIETFCNVFNLDKAVLTERTFSVDTESACTLDEFIYINSSEVSETLEEFLNSSMIQDIMKLSINEIYDDKFHAIVKRIS